MYKQTITFAQWDAASTEQRQAWLDAGVLVQAADVPVLNAKAFARKSAADNKLARKLARRYGK